MPRLSFTLNLQRHVTCPERTIVLAPGVEMTLRAVLEQYFQEIPAARGYVLDDQGALRQHMVVFIAGTPVRDRVRLSDPVAPDAQVCVFQALSGG